MAFNFLRRNKKNTRPSAARDYYTAQPVKGGVSGTAFACVDRIASEFALLNYAVYDAELHQKMKDHELYKLMKEPNGEEYHYNFFYQSALDYYNGGCFWLKSIVLGELTALFRLDPRNVKVRRDPVSNRKVYVYNGIEYSADRVVHIPSRFNFSTLTGGKSIYEAARSTFDTASSVDAFTQSSFTNGVVGKRLVIDVSGAFPDLTDEQAQQIKGKFQSEYSGLENAGRPILKKKGIEYSELSGANTSDNQAAELGETRKFQEKEIAKLFGVPLDILNGNIQQSNLENVFTLFSEFAVRPMATQFQESINSFLEDGCYFEFDFNGITKVALSQRIDAQIKQIDSGLMTINEGRQMNDLPPIEAGDTTFMPVNMMPWNDEIKAAYMAKQKKEVQQADPLDEDTQHIPQGDDKQ